MEIQPQLIGILNTSNKQRETFRVYEGITDSQIDQLISYTQSDPLVSKFTSDRKRFLNRDMFTVWREKKRSIYTLADQNGTLAGIMWFGRKEISPSVVVHIPRKSADYGITFAIRLYQNARGKHLAGKFMRFVFQAFKQTATYQTIPHNGIWVKTSVDNLPAVCAYRSLGFKEVSIPDEKEKIVMILEETTSLPIQ